MDPLFAKLVSASPDSRNNRNNRNNFNERHFGMRGQGDTTAGNRRAARGWAMKGTMQPVDLGRLKGDVIDASSQQAIDFSNDAEVPWSRGQVFTGAPTEIASTGG